VDGGSRRAVGIVEPLLPRVKAARTGRPRVADRTAFGAIVFVLFTGTPWKQIPRELGCSGSTVWVPKTRLRRESGVSDGLRA
jgi:transposase